MAGIFYVLLHGVERPDTEIRAQKVHPGEENSHALPAGTRTGPEPFDHESGAALPLSWLSLLPNWYAEEKSGRGFSVLKRVKRNATLRASLSGTFLQTLPALVTPRNGHSLSPRSCPPTRSAPSGERFGYWSGTDHTPSIAFKEECCKPKPVPGVWILKRLW